MAVRKVSAAWSHSFLRPSSAGGAPSAEQRAAHAVGGLGGVGEQARRLAWVLAGQNLPQAGDRRLIAGLNQLVMRYGGPRSFPQGDHQTGLEPGEGGGDDSSGRLSEAGAPATDVTGEEVQASWRANTVIATLGQGSMCP